MRRIQITHLKAPWPAGAVVGDVLDLPAVPVWAVGKCNVLPDEVFVVNPAEPVEADEPKKRKAK